MRSPLAKDRERGAPAGRLQEQAGAWKTWRERRAFRARSVDELHVSHKRAKLLDRLAGEQRLAAEVLRAQRSGRPLTILVIDLDGLKFVNDNFGHPAGDELIRSFAQCMNKAIRGSDLAVRFGGDEFLVLLPDCKLEEVRYVLNRLSGQKMEHKGVSMAIGFSAGSANLRSGESAEELLKRADDALYVNKRATKDPAGTGAPGT